MNSARRSQRLTAKFSRIAADVKLGKGVQIYDFANLYGCEIGDGSKIGTFVEIQKGAKIGKRCKISSHTFICEGVTIEDECFIGHHVVFINDRFPLAVNPDGSWQTQIDSSLRPACASGPLWAAERLSCVVSPSAKARWSAPAAWSRRT
jgi:UDP-3-O-[3-hydroxymyristoyl] glucosamine N-acyltransferase